MRKVLSVFVAGCLVLSLFTGVFAPVPSARAATEGDYTYDLNGTAPETAKITGYTGAGGVVIIPSTLGGYPVTSIGISVFWNCTALTSVTIGSGVTSIGDNAFHGCTGLTSVTIPNSVTYIGDSAFSYCSALASVTIPNSVTTIGDNAFLNCTGLTSLTIGSGVTSIGVCAFAGCTALTSVTIPNSVITIGNRAFSDCTALTSVTIPDSVTSIGGGVFYRCSGLTSVTIGSGVTSISDNAFDGCTRLTSVTIPSGVTSIGVSAFYYCTALTSVTIGSGVTSIGDNAFQYCSGLTSVTIPNSVTTIGGDAFSDCSGLTSVTIPNSVTTIGAYAFLNCSGLTSVTIGSGVTSIGAHAFQYCWGLTSVTIGSGVTSIGDNAFHGCTRLTSVSIGSGVTTIGESAFYQCTALTSVTIPNSVTRIDTSAFGFCSGLTSVSIGSGVTTIGYAAFQGCTALTSVTIPSGVTSIGQQAFQGCTQLTAAYFLGNAPTGTTDMFQSCATGFAVWYISGKTGWTTPTWYGYPTATSVIVTYAVTLGTITRVAGDTTSTVTIDATPVAAGATVTLTVAPKAGMQLKAGTLVATYNGGTVATLAGTGPYTFTMPAYAVEVTAEFEAIPPTTYAVTFSVIGANGALGATVDGAAITTGALVAAGKDVVFTPVPATGYQVKAWTMNGTAAGGEETIGITVPNLPAAIAVTVEFEAISSTTYAVTVNMTGSGTISRSPNATSYASGTVVTLTATPATGYTFTGWSGDLSGATNPTTITMNGNKTVTATFTSSTATPGDVDGDGSVTMLDALLSARAAVGMTTLTGSAFQAADANHDGTITMMDVLLIARIAVGSVDTTPPAPVLLSPAPDAVLSTLTPTLSWSVVPGATKYEVKIWVASATPPPYVVDEVLATTSYTVPTGVLSSGVRYSWTVFAGNSVGWGPQLTVPGSTLLPAFTVQATPTVPTGVTATAANGQVTISWDAVSGATSYNIYWSTTSGVTKSGGTKITGATSPYSHTGRTSGTPYYYIVTAVHSYGESSASSEVSATPAGGSVWNIQTIDQVNSANNDISAVIDANNAIHVCYSDFNNGLKYATNKTGAWVSTYIHQEDINTYVTGGGGDIAVDGNNNAHIVYSTISLSETPHISTLYYATNSSGSWIKTKLVEVPDAWSFSGSGIIATGNGKVHIAFGGDDSELVYLNNISGSWSAPILIGSYWPGVRPRLALDSNDNVYIAYEHGGEDSLRLGVVNSSGSLVSNTVLDGPGVSGTEISTGWDPNIAIDKASNLIYISYWDENNKSLMLYSAGGITTIDSYETGYPPESGIAVDQNGKVYISFSDPGSGKLKYATNKSGSWVVETLAPLSTSSHSDIVIESTGKIDLIFSNRTTNYLSVISK